MPSSAAPNATASLSSPTKKITVALIGNPNTGKSTLFNSLAGLNARVGNYPGVTVEQKLGHFRHAGHEVELVDLPGTYSLSARTQDELVSVRVLLGTQQKSNPLDAVICIVDATHLQRNLYLFSQVLDLGLPAILVLNMWDQAEKMGIEIDVETLQQRLGVPVIKTSARHGKGIDQVRDTLIDVVEQSRRSEDNSPSQERLELFPESFCEQRKEFSAEVSQEIGRDLPEYLAERLLLDVGGETERELLQRNENLITSLHARREKLAEAGCPIPAIEPRVRYQWVKSSIDGLVTQVPNTERTWNDWLDRWLTGRITGPVIFAMIMLLMFQAIYTWAGPLMSSIEWMQELATESVAAVLSPGALRSLINDGIIAGVGAVVVFLPQIAILFLFIAVLEDCGYMSRAAFIMDRLMTRVGLSGKSFVPMMSSYACAIPGIMATRTIEDRKDRFVTMLVAPLMSCSARLPVYLILIYTFIPDRNLLGSFLSLQAVTLFCFYLLGALVAIPVAWILKKTWFKGEPAPFVMELPSFKWPALRVVFYRVWDRCKSFLYRAGSLIFVTSVLVWAAGYFPGDRTELHQLQTKMETEEATDEQMEVWETEHRQLSSKLLNSSFLGMAGHAIEPAVRPLGWDWRIGVGALASFPAREVIIGTLGTIFSLGGDVDENDEGLMDRLASAQRADGTPLFNIPVALSVMVFFALCAQCGATLMVMQRETNSWRWPIFAFTYMTVLAYVGAMITYQVGMLILQA